jgi:hypothetical protein
VRGTLRALRLENKADKHGELWFSYEKHRRDDGSTYQKLTSGMPVSTPADLAGKENPGAGAPGTIDDLI